jgi:hypothetical protein
MYAANVFGYLAGMCLLFMASMKTQAQMRAFNIAGNSFFILYGWFGGLMPVLILNSIMLGLLAYRLSQVLSRPKSFH